MKKTKYPWIAFILILLFVPLIMGAYEDTSRINIYDFVDGDYGDWSISSNSATLDPNTVAASELASGDYGDVSISAAGVITLDPNTVGASELASGDYTDVSISAAGAITLDDDVVGPAELADGDYGDVLMSSGAITVDPNATPTVAGLTVQGTFQAYYTSEAVKTTDYSIASTDFGKSLRMNATTDKTFSLPSVADANDGATITLEKMGSGRLTIDAADSDYIHNSGAGDGIYNDDNSTYATLTLRYCHADVRWYIVGGMGAWVTYD